MTIKIMIKLLIISIKSKVNTFISFFNSLARSNRVTLLDPTQTQDNGTDRHKTLHMPQKIKNKIK